MVRQIIRYVIAGHNNNDPGAIGYDGISEHFRNVHLQEKIIHGVEGYRIIAVNGTSVIVNTDSQEHSLRRSIDLINRSAGKDDVGSDLHFNFNHPTATGFEIIIHPYTTEENKRRAIYIANEVSGLLDIPLRRRCLRRDYIFPSETPRGRIAIIEDTVIPFVLPEFCFLNQHDLIKYEANEDEVANIIKRALFFEKFNKKIAISKPINKILVMKKQSDKLYKETLLNNQKLPPHV